MSHTYSLPRNHPVLYMPQELPVMAVGKLASIFSDRQGYKEQETNRRQ